MEVPFLLQITSLILTVMEFTQGLCLFSEPRKLYTF